MSRRIIYLVMIKNNNLSKVSQLQIVEWGTEDLRSP